MARLTQKEIAEKWQKRWEEASIFKAKEDSKKKKFYVLEMFPYPSGSGLHMGHALNYTIGDIFARYKRMTGFNVLHPMGFDSFGLPAENAAIKAKSHPKKFTEDAIKNYIKQMKGLGISYDWDRMVETHKEDYYKWDQWIFLKMFEKGLAYKKTSPVNWCSKCNTVLANEQVHNGKCWRHEDTDVEVKNLEQWFFKTTAYAEELYDGIDKLDGWPDLIKKLQRNWINKSYGAEIVFKMPSKDKVVFLHGKISKPIHDHEWYNWFEKESNKNKINFNRLRLPGGAEPRLNDWLKKIDESSPDETTVLVGHSLGCTAILRWLEKAPKNKKIKKVILIAPPSSNRKKEIDFYSDKDYDYKKIKTHCDDFVVFHSKDDDIIPYSSGMHISNMLNAKFHSFEDKLHIGRKIDSLPELVDEISQNWKVFTTRPDTLMGVTFLVVSAQHSRLSELVTKENKLKVDAFVKKLNSVKEEDLDQMEKEGVFTGSYAVHPITGEQIPVYAGNFVLADYGSGMVMAVPAHDQRDFEFAKKYNINIKQVILSKNGKITELNKAYTESGVLVNSGKFDDLDSAEAKKVIVEELEKNNLGKQTVNYRLRDWLISRQRFWGTPIPILYCDKCGVVPVPEKDLPVKLPEDVVFESAENPLKDHNAFLNATCPRCKGNARRETDTMDTFVNSSWYYLRYSDPKNNKVAFSEQKANYWCPIDQYIGGKEHACMHLIYIRFYTKFLRDIGLVNFDEPAIKLFNQGMLQGPDGEKMSKSKGNVVLPEVISEKFGLDSARLFLISVASPDKDINWSDQGTEGSARFIKRIFDYVENVKFGETSKRVESKLHSTIKQVGDLIESFKYNIATIKIRELFESFEQEISKKDFECFLKLLSPICPHITEELWENIGNKPFISTESWPEYDESKIDEKLDYFEEIVENLRKDIIDVMRIVKIEEPKEIKFIVSDSWKYYLTNMFKDLTKDSFNQKDVIQKIMASDLKKHGQDVMRIVPSFFKDASKLPKQEITQSEEKTLLEDHINFFKKEFGAKIIIELAENSKEQKAKNALPGKPAILIK